jgi:basic amino acid/polyamine antiporter, APA family
MAARSAGSVNRPSNTELARRLGLTDAVFIGLGSMIGAGVFAVFAPAARAAGAALMVGLLIALVVAYCNATSSAQLAAAYPFSGGSYLYGREQLGEWWGYLAGWGFVVGKTASCAAMALTFAAYAAPGHWQRPTAIAAVIGLTTVNCIGVTRTAVATRLIVGVVVTVLAVLVISYVLGGPADTGNLNVWSSTQGLYGVLQSAGLLFFAFAGYARIATLGEEVRDPGRTIPRAIVLALAIAAVIYAAVGASVIAVLSPERLAHTSAPLEAAAEVGSWSWTGPVVRVAAALATLGALLALIAGIGRTALAMARQRDLPGWFDHVDARFQVPQRTEVLVAVTTCVIVAVVDVRGAIGFSSFGVLLYYFVANLAAYTQSDGQRRYPRPLQLLGATACVVLVATLPIASLLAGLIVFAVGFGYRLIRLRLAR